VVEGGWDSAEELAGLSAVLTSAPMLLSPSGCPHRLLVFKAQEECQSS